jgi:hypothetical protein
LVSAGSGGSVQAALNGSQVSSTDSPGASEWCCDALTGIESAFSGVMDSLPDEKASKTKREMQCLYCGEAFDAEATDWFLRGQHLAHMHHFGACNLLLSYPTWVQFMQHLIEFHELSTDGQGLVEQHVRTATTFHFHRGPESKTQITRQAEESAHTEGFYHARLGTIMQKLEDACFRPHLYSQEYMADPTATSINVSTSFLLEREAACLQEEFIISGHTFQALENPVALAAPRLWPESEVLMLNSDFEAFLQCSLNVRKLKNNMSRREWISLWLYEILLESHTTRVIMRDLTMDKHPYVLGMRIWLEEVLKAWDVDEAATGAEQPYDLSDGAVDSRDSLEVLEVP